MRLRRLLPLLCLLAGLMTLAGGAMAQTPFVSADFGTGTGTGNPSITTFTPGTGGAFVLNPFTGYTQTAVLTNTTPVRVRANSGAAGEYSYHAGTAATQGNYDVWAKVTMVDASTPNYNVGIEGHSTNVGSTNDNGVSMDTYPSSSSVYTIRFYHKISGSTGTVSSATTTFVSGNYIYLHLSFTSSGTVASGSWFTSSTSYTISQLPSQTYTALQSETMPAGLQTNGTSYVSVNGYNGASASDTIGSQMNSLLATYPSTALVGGTITANATTTSAITPQALGITGGTAPYSTVFSYSTTTNGTYTQIGTAVTGANPVASTSATGLTPNTTYYFRGVTTDSAGTPATVTVPSTTTGTPLATNASVGSSYTTTVSPNPVSVGGTITITYVANGPTTAAVTPAQSGVSGSFGTSTVTLSGTTPVTDTFTPTSAGTASFTSTNTGSLTATSEPITDTVNAVAVTILYSNANLQGGLSPRNWVIDTTNGRVYSANTGASWTWTFTSTTSAVMNTPTSQLTGQGIYLKWSVDNGPWQTAILTSASTASVTLFNSLSNATHSVQGYLIANDFNSDIWGVAGAAPTDALQITSLTLDAGGGISATAAPTVQVEVQGDSITAGCRVLGAGNAEVQDATQSWSYYAGQGLGAGGNGWTNVGFPGQAWDGGGSGNSPAYADGSGGGSWQSIDNAHSRSYSTPPSYLLVNMGTNHSTTTGTLATSGSTGRVRGNIAGQRSAVGASCKIIYLIPFGAQNRANLLNDFSYYQGGTTASNGYTSVSDGATTIYSGTADPNTWMIYLGATEAAGLAQYPTASREAYDGLHPSYLEGPRLAALVVQAIKAKEGGTTTTIGRGRTLR